MVLSLGEDCDLQRLMLSFYAVFELCKLLHNIQHRSALCASRARSTPKTVQEAVHVLWNMEGSRRGGEINFFQSMSIASRYNLCSNFEQQIFLVQSQFALQASIERDDTRTHMNKTNNYFISKKSA